MPEPKDKDTDPKNTKDGDPGETGSKKTGKDKAEPFESENLSDEDFEKVFDDPRLFKHKRFKSLNERAKKADEFETKQKEETEKRLKEEGKLKELLELKEKELSEAVAKNEKVSLDSRIQAEAAKQGAVDLDAVTKLIDRSGIKTEEDGSVSGVEDAVKGLLESKPYLVGSGGTPANIGSGTNPPGTKATTVKKFKHSQILDTDFYAEHEDEIQEAIKHGQVEHDLPDGFPMPR